MSSGVNGRLAREGGTSPRRRAFLRLVAVFVVSLAVILSIQTAFANEESEKHYQQGEIYASAENYEQAIKEYTRAIEIDPNDATYYNNRGWAYYYQKKYAEAENDFKTALEKNPSNPSYAHRGMASVYLIKGNNDVAKEYYTKSAKHVYYDYKRYELAAKDFGMAITLGEETSEIYNLRGWCYFNLENYDDALTDFSKAIQIDDNPSAVADAYSGRASVYRDSVQKRSIESAKINFKEAGRIYLNEKNYAKAREELKKSIDLDSNYGEAYYWLGLVEFYQSNYHEAVIKFDEAIRSGFAEDYVYNDRGASKVHLKQYDGSEGAIEDYNKAISKDKTYTLAYKNLADIYNGRNEPQKASDNAKNYLKYVDLNGEEIDEKTRKTYENMIIPEEPTVLELVENSLSKVDDILIALFAVMILDYMMIIARDKYEGTLTAVGAIRALAFELILVVVLVVLYIVIKNFDKLSGLEIVLISIFLIYELFSILESAERLGVPIPQWLKDVLKKIRDIIDGILGRRPPS
mgnify:CR=1 FL=1